VNILTLNQRGKHVLYKNYKLQFSMIVEY